MYDWKVWFINPNTRKIDYLNLSYRYTADRAKKEFHDVFPGTRIKEIRRMNTFRAEEKLKRMRAT